MQQTMHDTLGTVTEKCLARAWSDWRKQHYPRMSAEECWANEIQKMELALELRQTHLLTVTTTILPRDPRKKETYVGSLERVGHMMFVWKAWA